MSAVLVDRAGPISPGCTGQAPVVLSGPPASSGRAVRAS